MYQLVGALNRHFETETDDFCRYCLLHSLGSIAHPSSVPIFEYLMAKGDKRDEWSILVAAKSFDRAEFHGYLTGVFENCNSKKSHRILAAWGLAKLGERSPYDYLISMLSDPEIRTPTSHDPGQSLRAAQAISDINSWTFEWTKSSVDLVKRLLNEQNS